jgi:hypothetical protein
MPKPYTLPTLYDDCYTLNISRLKQWGYLEPGCQKHGTITWSRYGEILSSISIIVNTIEEHRYYVSLSYNYRGEPRKYNVLITSVNSNLNKGKVLYFICPQTKKRCRKLYLIDGYFLHREAFNGCMYESQTHSKRNRDLLKIFNLAILPDGFYSQRYKKYFKTHYKGKPTKRYQKYLQRVETADSFPPDTMTKLLMI